MTKKISIKTPTPKPNTAEEWVNSREGTKRLTIDVSMSLHAKLKIASAQNGQTMAEIVKESIERYLAKP